MTNADQRRVRKALQGMEFPATKQDMLTYVDDRGAGTATEKAVRALPDGTYDSADEAEATVPQSPESAGLD